MKELILRICDNELLYTLALIYVCTMAFTISFLTAYLIA